MTSGGLCPGEDFAWCSLCRRLSGCRGVYFPSRRFRYVDNKCMSVYVARLQNPSHLQYALGNYPTHSGLIFTISWKIYIYIYIHIYTHTVDSFLLFHGKYKYIYIHIYIYTNVNLYMYIYTYIYDIYIYIYSI